MLPEESSNEPQLTVLKASRSKRALPRGLRDQFLQWMLPRPTDIMSLRLDNTERQTVELSDIVLSSTRYMASWLRQRSWVLPQNRYACLSADTNLIIALADAQSLGICDLAWKPTHPGQHRQSGETLPAKLIEPTVWQPAAVLSLPKSSAPMPMPVPITDL